jgi:hypothetical protein
MDKLPAGKIIPGLSNVEQANLPASFYLLYPK